MAFKVKELLEKTMPDVRPEPELLNKLEAFKVEWGTKDDTYIEFLGTGLLGINPIRFSVKDEDGLMTDILGVDKNELQSDLYLTPGVNKNFKVSSNVINITLVYLIHLFAKSKLDPKLKTKAMNVLYHIFAYKQIGSLYSHYFQYSVDKNLAQTVFETLPNKFLLKKLGSWEALFDYQTELLLPPKGLHSKRVMELTDDDVIRIINDMQSRVRSTVKNLTIELHNFINSKSAKIVGTSLVQTTEEGDELKDLTSGYGIQTDYLKSIIHSPNDFIVDDYIYVIGKLISNCNTEKLRDVLNYVSAYESNSERVLFITDTVIKQSITYLRTKGITGNYIKYISTCLKELKGYFSASKVKNPDILKSKKLAYDLIADVTRNNTKWFIVPMVLGLFLYLFLRSVNR